MMTEREMQKRYDNMLPPDPPEEPDHPFDGPGACPVCQGDGFHWVLDQVDGWVNVDCRRCDGTGRKKEDEDGGE
jgi:hypothetical protein